MSTLCKTYSDEARRAKPWSACWPRARPAARSGC